MEVGGEGNYIHLSLHCHYLNDVCIKVGSEESHFNVSLTVGAKSQDSVHRPQLFEERGEPKRNRTELFLLTSLTPYR